MVKHKMTYPEPLNPRESIPLDTLRDIAPSGVMVIPTERVLSARQWLEDRKLGKTLNPIDLNLNEMLVFYKKDWDEAFNIK